MNPVPSRLENSAFYILLAVAVLSPLAFWPSAYAPLDLAKAVVIILGILASAALLAILALKERKTACVPRSIFWTGLLLCLSIAVSAILSGHAGKSFFGQGFETGTASFILVLFLGACATFKLVKRDTGRAMVLYAAIVASFLILYIFQFLRLVFGSGFASLGILSGTTSTIFGSWLALGAFALVVVFIAFSALLFLPLSRRLKFFYWILIALAALGALVINDMRVWGAAAVVFLGLAVYASIRKSRMASGFLSRIAWIPVLACIVSALLFWKGTAAVAPLVHRLGASYTEVPSLSWRGTLDVGAGAIKDSPLLGIGPNRFSAAYVDNKPADVNSTLAWNLEFASGWSTLSTFAATQGLIGIVLWILFFVFFAIAAVRALKRLPEDPQSRFLLASSLSASVFIWLMALVSVLPHALLFLAFVLTGIFLATAAASDSLVAFEIAPSQTDRFSSRLTRLFPVAAAVGCLVLIVWGLIYVKKTMALSYFASGVRELTTSPSFEGSSRANADFAVAGKWDSSDIYLQARAEAAIAQASALVAKLNQQTPAAISQTVGNQAVALVGDALNYADAAVALDPDNYYNYVSKARVATAGARLGLANAYDTAVQAYASAIQLNPNNPSLYLSLAQLQASANKLDDALVTLGAALRVKNNYIDAVFLLSQVEAAKGNLADAITAAQFAAQLNPQSPIAFFQLGLLQYNAKSYAAAAQAFAQAVKLQPDYANAQYFLGLSDARLGRTADALIQFQSLAASNPDNQEVQLIFAKLKAGKSIFAEAPSSVAAAPEKRPGLPIKQK